MDMLFISIFVSNAYVMVEDNAGRIRLGRVSQIASVRSERVATTRTTRLQFTYNVFDHASTSLH